MEVFPRETSASGEGAAWKLQLGTRAFGREGDLFDLGVGKTSIDEGRAELDRGALVEWFVNREEGIEQGWTIEQRPGGVEPLVIVLSVEGELSLRIDESGRSGVFVDARGERRVAYRDLRAWDAEGVALDVWFEPTPEGVAVRVDDSGAQYPIIVDPLLGDPAWTAESDQESAWFGCSVCSAGDVNGDGYSDVVIGAREYDSGEVAEGRVYVHHGSASGLELNHAWSAESDQEFARFGVSVSTAGDVNGDGYSDVVVGAVGYGNPEPTEGRAYVYHGSASGLEPNPTWTAESNQAHAWFGHSVSTAGDVNGDGYSDVVVGAPLYDDDEADEGRAYVYHGSASGLELSHAWTAESNQAEAEFGYSVSSAGDVNGDGYSDVVVGVRFYSNGEYREGRAYAYHGSASGLELSQAWTAEVNQVNAWFGESVSTAGDVNGDGYTDVIVGTRTYDNGQVTEGRAYAYHGSASGLELSHAWTAESNQEGGQFGCSVSTAGDINGDGYSDVVVGARGYSNGETTEGRVYAYEGSASGLQVSHAWTAESNQAGAEFGFSVSTAGDVNRDGYSDVIVGAHRYDSGQNDEGAAFAYHGSAAGLASASVWTEEPDQVGANLGWSVSGAGDVNGDGYSDFLVGAFLYDDGESDEGAAFLYHGSPSGPAATPDWTVQSNQADSRFGYSVSGAGDVNGDGYSDVVVGAYDFDSGQAGEGVAFVYHGAPGGLPATANWVGEEDQAGARFGWSVSSAGDVNGDGFSDLVVGAVRFSDGELEEGGAFVYHGSASGLAGTSSWSGQSNDPVALYGSSVSTAGDVNGDGFSDILVTAEYYDGGQVDEGRAYVYLGSKDGVDTIEAWSVESNQTSARLGLCGASAGDVNGDGYSDVIVGAHNYDNPEVNEGQVFVFHGSAGGLPGTADWTYHPNIANVFFGSAVSSAGDVNGDGYSDVVIGAHGVDNGQANEGRAYVFRGSASGLASSPAWVVESNQPTAFFGRAVACAGDVNGDGYSDVLVGAHGYDGGQTDEGRAYLFLGNGGDFLGNGGGWVQAPRHLRIAGVGKPIGLLGNSDKTYGFRIRAELAHDLTGFAWATPAAPTARLEWRVLGVTSTYDSGIDAGAVFPVGPTPMVFDRTVGGLPDGEQYRWQARFRTNNPLFPVTPWFSVPGNARTEAKLRTPLFIVEDADPPSEPP